MEKEFLIKVVVQAILTYMMSLFKNLDGIIDDVYGMLPRFWLGSNETNRKMHWCSWDALCKPKAMRETDFRNLYIFNQA